MEEIVIFLIIVLLVPEKYKEILFKFIWNSMQKTKEIFYALYDKIKQLTKKEADASKIVTSKLENKE